MVFRIVEDKLILSENESSSPTDGITVISEIPSVIFCEYNMEGVSSDFNEIYLEVKTGWFKFKLLIYCLAILLL